MSFLSTCITSYGYGLKIVSSGWSFVSAVLVKVPEGFLLPISVGGRHCWHLIPPGQGVPVRLLGLLALAMAAVCASMAIVRLRGYGMIHNDEDRDNDANDGDDDEREISWK
ncbi:hypothetical protein Tco_0560029 [Tanacetum coccineum]